MKNGRDPQVQAQINDFLRRTKEQQEVFQFVAQVMAVQRAIQELSQPQLPTRPTVGHLLQRAYAWLHPTVVADDNPEVIIIEQSQGD